MGGVSTDSPPLDSVRKLSWSFRCETRIWGENYSSDLYQAIRDEFLDALAHVPQRPGTNTSRTPPFSIEEYVKWRTKISGHRLLFNQYFSSSKVERSRFTRALDLVLEIDACITVRQRLHASLSSLTLEQQLVIIRIYSDITSTRHGTPRKLPIPKYYSLPHI